LHPALTVHRPWCMAITARAWPRLKFPADPRGFRLGLARAIGFPGRGRLAYTGPASFATAKEGAPLPSLRERGDHRWPRLLSASASTTTRERTTTSPDACTTPTTGRRPSGGAALP